MVWKTTIRHILGRAAPALRPDPALAKEMSARLQAGGARKLGRALSIRHVAAGSCNGCELELRAIQNLIYDLTQYGLSFVASPRHADILLVTGVSNRNMAQALRQARTAMPEPALVVAVGDCALDGGVFKGSPVVLGGAKAVVPVDLVVAGCPPNPAEIIAGLVALVDAHDTKMPPKPKILPGMT
ncbi:NADH-quinone oxidoreductase subunit B family protein [Acidocella sp.]|uniref:NADH-quinone oxidoreductase subunit B family protein n=1 Tax=Acidocella sp. TaxID=50710 RepID=UPI00263259B2|nr:hydrogenase [Acidocella sp.]